MHKNFLKTVCTSIAGRYAFALAKTTNNKEAMQKIFEEVATIASFLESGGYYRHFLLNVFKSNTFPDWWEEFLKLSGFQSVTINFIKLLLNNRRIRSLPDIVRILRMLVDEKFNRVSIIVYTAEEIGESNKNVILEKLGKIFKKNISATFEIKKSILGGLIVESDTVTIDASVKHQIEKLANSARGYFYAKCEY